MRPSRRELLGATIPLALGSLAGCLSSVPATGGSSESDHSFEARLGGPDDDWPLFDGTDVDTVGGVEEARGGRPYVPVVLTEDATAAVSETFRSAGVADDPDAFEVVLSLDGEALERFGVAPSLVEAVSSGDWAGEMRLTFADRATASDVRAALCDGGDAGPDCTTG